ncbi:hypothetical protein MMPV_002839 [Pyropia vietnamensis]
MTVPVAGPAAVGLPAWAGRPAAFVGGVHPPPPRALARAPCARGGGVGDYSGPGSGGGASMGSGGRRRASWGVCRRRVAMAAAVAVAVVPCGVGVSAFGGARLGATGRRQPHGRGTGRLLCVPGLPRQHPLQRSRTGGRGGCSSGRSASGAAGVTAVFVWSSDNFFSDGPGDEENSSVGGSGGNGSEPDEEGEAGDVFPLGEGATGDCGEGVLQAGTHHMGLGEVGATGGAALGSGMLDCIFMVEEEANGSMPLRASWLNGDSGLGLGSDNRQQIDFGVVSDFPEYTPLDSGRGADAPARGADADSGPVNAFDSDSDEVANFDSDNESEDDSDDDEDREEEAMLYVLDDDSDDSDDSDDEDDADGTGDENDSDDDEDDDDLHDDVTLLDVNFDDADFALALCDVPSFLGLQFDGTEEEDEDDEEEEEDNGDVGHSLLATVDNLGVVGFGAYRINEMVDRHLDVDSLQAVDLSLVSELAAARLSPACVRSEKVLYEVIAHYTLQSVEALSLDVSPAGQAAIRHSIVSRYGNAPVDDAAPAGLDGAGVLAAAVAAAAAESPVASPNRPVRPTTAATAGAAEAIISMSAGELNQAIYTALAAGYLLRGSEFRYLLSRTLDAPAAVDVSSVGTTSVDGGASSVRGSGASRDGSVAVPPATAAARSGSPSSSASTPPDILTATPGGPLLGWLKGLDPSSAGGMAVELTPAAAGAFRRVVASLTGDVPMARLAVRAAYRLPRRLLAALTLWSSMLGYVTHAKDSRLHVEETWRRALGGRGATGGGAGGTDVDDRGPPPAGTDRAGG